MKLKGIKTITKFDIDKAWGLTQDIYDLYTESDECKEITVNSELIGGVLTTARVLAWTSIDTAKKLRKVENQRNVLIGLSTALASYHIYNELLKDSKVVKRMKNKISKK